MYYGEKFNSISHLVGASFALVGGAVLITMASMEGDVAKIVSYSVYAVTLFLLYLSSTLYHSFPGRVKPFFRVLDHQAIYLLIAGTYTPFSLVTLRGTAGWSLFGAIWATAVTGIVLDAFPHRGRRILPVVVYVTMGWLALVALNPLLEALAPGGFTWLLAGGALVLEMDPDQTEGVAERAGERFREVEVVDDLAGRARAVVARRPLTGR